MEAAAWGLFGTAVGALSSIGTAWLSTRSSFAMQRTKQADERAERAKDFQRKTLLALQEALHDMLRLGARAHIEDGESFREVGTWGRQLLSPEVNEGLRLSRRRVAILIERVADDSLRNDVKELAKHSSRSTFAQTEQEAELLQEAVFAEANSLLEKIGSVFRSY